MIEIVGVVVFVFYVVWYDVNDFIGELFYLVYCDIKFVNICIILFGDVKVLDFGVV